MWQVLELRLETGADVGLRSSHCTVVGNAPAFTPRVGACELHQQVADVPVDEGVARWL